MQFKNVGADGNCLPRVVAHGIFGNEELHLVVREQLCDRLAESRQYLQYFILDDESFEGYITRMRKFGTWMDNFATVAACAVYNCNIIVYELNNAEDDFVIRFDLADGEYGGWDAEVFTDDVDLH